MRVCGKLETGEGWRWGAGDGEATRRSLGVATVRRKSTTSSIHQRGEGKAGSGVPAVDLRAKAKRS
jgi:hypothetical protein